MHLINVPFLRFSCRRINSMHLCRKNVCDFSKRSVYGLFSPLTTYETFYFTSSDHTCTFLHINCKRFLFRIECWRGLTCVKKMRGRLPKLLNIITIVCSNPDYLLCVVTRVKFYIALRYLLYFHCIVYYIFRITQRTRAIF